MGIEMLCALGQYGATAVQGHHGANGPEAHPLRERADRNYRRAYAGEHTLTMQFANGAHLSYGEAMSTTIKVTVLPTPEKLGVGFKNLTDGAKVKGEFDVEFDVVGMDIKPAGEDLKSKTTGHHHLIIDGKPIPTGELVPMNETHIHFGKGQTSTKLTLEPGPHTLTLQFADGAHLSYGEAMSATINVVAE